MHSENRREQGLRLIHCEHNAAFTSVNTGVLHGTTIIYGQHRFLFLLGSNLIAFTSVTHNLTLARRPSKPRSTRFRIHCSTWEAFGNSTLEAI